MRLEQLQREYGDRLTIEWRSFLLQPEARAKPLDRFRRYTERWVRADGPGGCEPLAEFKVWGDETPPTHSVPAAIAGKCAATFGAGDFDRFHLALMRAYFTQHRDVSSRDVVVAVAGEVGIDAEAFELRLRERGTPFYEAVIADHAAASDHDIYAVPTVLVNDTLAIPGAQELDNYRRVIDRLVTRQVAGEPGG